MSEQYPVKFSSANEKLLSKWSKRFLLREKNPHTLLKPHLLKMYVHYIGYCLLFPRHWWPDQPTA